MSASIAPVRGISLLLRRPGRALSLVAAFVVAVLYVWVAAVRAVPRVRKRKAAIRARGH
jgi:hypothetical protein